MIINVNNKGLSQSSIQEFYASIPESNFNLPSNPVLEAKQRVDSIVIGKSDDTYYIESEDLWTYMRANGLEDVSEALDNIIDFYSESDIDANNICVIVDENSIIRAELESTGVAIQEKSTYSDASNLQKEKKWYNNFISKMKSDADSIAEIDSRISVLKQCVAKMEDARDNGNTGDQVKYALKSWIPFNSIVRFLKNKDKVAGIGWAAGLLTSLIGIGGIVEPVVRASLYNRMLDDNIKATKEAIEFLEKKKEELSKSKDEEK